MYSDIVKTALETFREFNLSIRNTLLSNNIDYKLSIFNGLIPIAETNIHTIGISIQTIISCVYIGTTFSNQTKKLYTEQELLIIIKDNFEMISKLQEIMNNYKDRLKDMKVLVLKYVNKKI